MGGIDMKLAQFTRTWVKNKFYYFRVMSHQATSKLKDAADHAKGAGWEAWVRTHGFHCTAFVRSTGRGNSDQIAKRLHDARWGFVLAIQTTPDKYSIDWSSFRPV